MAEPKYIELIDRYLIKQGKGDYNPPSYEWVDNTGEIVRCKDCKHYKTMFCKMDIWHKDITLYRADENDFCSYGERKDG